MERREVRRVLRATFGVLLVGALVAATVWIIRIALDQAGALLEGCAKGVVGVAGGEGAARVGSAARLPWAS
jgi:hypothetical protein